MILVQSTEQALILPMISRNSNWQIKSGNRFEMCSNNCVIEAIGTVSQVRCHEHMKYDADQHDTKQSELFDSLDQHQTFEVFRL